jgi:hypothetical protein
MSIISENVIREGCVPIIKACPDPILWLAAGIVIGLWAASSIWLMYIHKMQNDTKDERDHETAMIFLDSLTSEERDRLLERLRRHN